MVHAAASLARFDVALFAATEWQRSLAVGVSPRKTGENFVEAAERRQNAPSPLERLRRRARGVPRASARG